jgi:hypothetical protein
MPEIPQALVGCGDADVAWLDQRGLLLSSLGMKLICGAAGAAA